MPTPSRQLLSRTIYDTDGTSTDWEFAFSGGYLDQSHVKAQVEEADGSIVPIVVTPLMLTNQFTLRIVPALAAGQVLTIYRDTPKDLPLVDFTDEAGFTEIALDTNAKQAIFVAAEATDSAGTVSTGDILSAADSAVAASAAAVAAATQAQGLLNLIAGNNVVIPLSGTGFTTSFSVSVPAGNVSDSVYINGVYQNKNTYTLSNNTLTFTQPPLAGSGNIELRLSIAQPLDALTPLVTVASAAATNAQNSANQAQLAADLVQAQAGAVLTHVGDMNNPHNTTATKVPFTPAAGIAATNVQAALEEIAGGVTIGGINDVPGLQTALDGKADVVHGHAIANVSGLQTALDGKQATLLSGTNIKTINGAPILGSGDLVVSGGGGTSDHGALTGLADDDHPQYYNQARGDARYAQASHTHNISAVTGLQAALDAKVAGPASSTDNSIPRFDGTTGKLLQGSGVTVDDSNNVGVGVTPSAWGANWKAMEFIGRGSMVGRSDTLQFNMLHNAFYDGSTFKYLADGLASRYVQNSGVHQWATAASGTSGGALTFTTAMTLDTSGNLEVTGQVFGGTSRGITRGFVTPDWRIYNGSSGNTLVFNNGMDRVTLDASGNLTLSAGALGYGTGAGGTVTQATSKATSVTLNKPNGLITLNGAALASGATVAFSLNNSFITAGDGFVVNLYSSSATADAYRVFVDRVDTGLARIVIQNYSGSSLSEAFTLKFTVIKGSTT